jgi:hypothetical protein
MVMPDNPKVVLVVLGGVLLLIAIVGGGFKFLSVEIPASVSNPVLRTLSGLLGIAILLPTFVDIPQLRSPATPPTLTPAVVATAPQATSTPTTPPGAKPTAIPPNACILTITNPFASLKQTPSHTGLHLLNVTPGEYRSMANQVVTFAGRQERWFQIQSEGHVGWIVDDGIQISSKTSLC